MGLRPRMGGVIWLFCCDMRKQIVLLQAGMSAAGRNKSSSGMYLLNHALILMKSLETSSSQEIAKEKCVVPFAHYSDFQK